MNQLINYGWCQSCAIRTGSKKFRELTFECCAECLPKYKQEPTKSVVAPPPTKKKKPPSKIDRAKLQSEENALLELTTETELGTHWRVEAAKIMGWSHEQIERIIHRIYMRGGRGELPRRKGIAEQKRRLPRDKARLRQEEVELISALKSRTFGDNWKKEVAEFLGWTKTDCNRVIHRIYVRKTNNEQRTRLMSRTRDEARHRQEEIELIKVLEANDFQRFRRKKAAELLGISKKDCDRRFSRIGIRQSRRENNASY